MCQNFEMLRIQEWEKYKNLSLCTFPLSGTVWFKEIPFGVHAVDPQIGPWICQMTSIWVTSLISPCWHHVPLEWCAAAPEAYSFFPFISKKIEPQFSPGSSYHVFYLAGLEETSSFYFPSLGPDFLKFQIHLVGARRREHAPPFQICGSFSLGLDVAKLIQRADPVHSTSKNHLHHSIRWDKGKGQNNISKHKCCVQVYLAWDL